MNRVLLDTNVWLWMTLDDPRLGPAARRMVEDTATEILLSTVSVWELTIKWSLGKIDLPVEPVEFVETTVRSAGLTKLPIRFDHALGVGQLAMIHRDPFDRLLIAQAGALAIPIVTSDVHFKEYAVSVIDATE